MEGGNSEVLPNWGGYLFAFCCVNFLCPVHGDGVTWVPGANFKSGILVDISVSQKC